MGAYGTHLTRYEGLSNGALYSMYRESVYKNLNEGEKLDLLQETVNRDALAYGEIGAPRVEFAELAANVSGEAANGVIKVDYDMAVNGRQSIVYHDRTVAHCVDDYNIQALNTVLHENAHCFQEQVADGTIEISDSQLAAQYQGNGFTTSAVLQDGSYRLGGQYLEGITPGGYYMYYFQATERDAFRMAEVKTNNILQELESQYGTEPSFQAYVRGVEVNGYQAVERRAIQLFHNPNFEHDVNQVLQNQYFGIKIPVHENTEHAVKNEMTATYESWLQETAQYDHLDLKELPV